MTLEKLLDVDPSLYTMSSNLKTIRLYHYLPAHWGIEDIRRHRMKLSTFEDANDPYEYRSIYSTDLLTQASLGDTARIAGERHGLLCFSREWNNIILWSHYGDNHRGVCLGVDVYEECTQLVRYVDQVQSVGEIASIKEAERYDIFNRLASVKYKGWRYEKEVRARFPNVKDSETGIYFVPFHSGLALKELIIGARCMVPLRQLRDALEGYSDIAITGLTANPKKFELIAFERRVFP